MFLYQTKTIYDKDGEGPLKGLVIKTTPNGIKDMIPAAVGEKVMFLEEKEAAIALTEKFEVGEKKEDEVSEEETNNEDEGNEG